MKRRGPLNGSGPGLETILRLAQQRSHNRSDTWRASHTSRSWPSLSKPAASTNLLADTTVVLTARGRSRFDALLDETQIVKASTNPISLFLGPYLELYSRKSAPGWTCWNNEIARASLGAPMLPGDLSITSFLHRTTGAGK
jgi:hypothetical protein